MTINKLFYSCVARVGSTLTFDLKKVSGFLDVPLIPPIFKDLSAWISERNTTTLENSEIYPLDPYLYLF